MTTILVAEDDSANMLLARELLKGEGYDVLEAQDGETAVRLARDKRPDLILMDVMMPGMDGLAATRILKNDAATRDIPVIALTGFAMEDEMKRMREAGCDDYIAKPFHYPELFERIQKWLAWRERP